MRPDRDRKDRRDKKPKAESKISAAARRWLGEVLPPEVEEQTQGEQAPWSVSDLVDQAPKRWVVYEPMVLLPTGSFGLQQQPQSPPTASSGTATASPWQRLLAGVSPEQQNALWQGILQELSPRGAKQPLTHLAINEGIPLHVEGGRHADGPENILRSPTGLRALYGDFGPSALARETEADETLRPREEDFAQALWVTTRQNGIVQTWAPRWSMFSRGNVKEKARLLAWTDGGDEEEADTREQNSAPCPCPCPCPSQYAVDLYAGIGYFVFSYARRGLNVLGWELNPWSTEALRRGAVRNGWRVRIVRGAAELARPTVDVVGGVGGDGGEGNPSRPPQIVIFVEDNRQAARRLAELRHATAANAATANAAAANAATASTRCINVAHANCGLLPTSTDSWRAAWDAVVGSQAPFRGWLHLHENVGVADIDRRKQAIQAQMESWAEEEEEEERKGGVAPGQSIHPSVQHVELVKTFAPGVWHCVFDVCITLRERG